jgi:hypothetical protein
VKGKVNLGIFRSPFYASNGYPNHALTLFYVEYLHLFHQLFQGIHGVFTIVQMHNKHQIINGIFHVVLTNLVPSICDVFNVSTRDLSFLKLEKASTPLN